MAVVFLHIDLDVFGKFANGVDVLQRGFMIGFEDEFGAIAAIGGAENVGVIRGSGVAGDGHLGDDKGAENRQKQGSR